MADKSEFVDLISDATRQVRRRIVRRAVEPEAKQESRLSHRSNGMAQWRERLFAVMSRNATGAATYFCLPGDRVMTVGRNVEL